MDDQTNSMTRIDFHTGIDDKMAYVCRLIRRARVAAADSRIVVLLKDRGDLARFDDALWTFSAQDFLPHVPANAPNADRTPVVLTDDDAMALPHHDILVNLSGKVPKQFAQFERVFEIVAQDETDTKSGRDRYAYYRQRGYPLTHNVASQT